MESVAVALITGVLAVLGTYVGNVTISRKKTREDAIREARRDQELTDKLDRLEKRLTNITDMQKGLKKSERMLP